MTFMNSNEDMNMPFNLFEHDRTESWLAECVPCSDSNRNNFYTYV